MISAPHVVLVLVVVMAGHMALSRLRRRWEEPGRVAVVSADGWAAVIFAALGWALGQRLVDAVVSAIVFGVLFTGFDIARRVWRDEW